MTIPTEVLEALGQQVFKRLKFWDKVIIIVVLLISALTFILFNTLGNGDTVEISVDGKIYGTYSLYENKTININTENGNIEIEISNNNAFVKDANCVDKKCIREGKISKIGQTIVCLPLKVMVKIGGTDYEYAY